MGVRPYLSRASRSAPTISSSRTTSPLPSYAAECMGVCPLLVRASRSAPASSSS
eukprot:CAMPEP_0206397430 /NCGR_PEP_ID=MMETSP0294-20121207/23464_1 /ASSEMBLY_ACC=CAM_ASM_000327 /TAXON_ID=39354 /ORGANISM="Heterosigma akashiwo, Strain CCMP2393" /LENGTH=53 /DNA_ID=CAMNT_0053852527 /DNA_START=67 /DNA_END=225 /DNA_ORIENTATION=-